MRFPDPDFKSYWTFKWITRLPGVLIVNTKDTKDRKDTKLHASAFKLISNY